MSLSTDAMSESCWKRGGPEICAERSKRGGCCREKWRQPRKDEFLKVIDRWASAAIKAGDGGQRFRQIALSIQREIGPAELDAALSRIRAAGGRYCDGLINHISQRRARADREISRLRGAQ